MKILITGGHLGPALAVIDEIGDKTEVVFVGRKFDLDQEKTFSLEYREITKRNIPFYHLQSGRLTRLLNFKLFFNLAKIPISLFQALKIITKEKPQVILSFGGYIGFPICLVGYILNIPIFIHEQTINPGLVNRVTGRLAKKIFVAFSEAKKYFPPEKVIVSGNPTRKIVLSLNKKPFTIRKNKPAIYFTGGSLGSHSVNLIVEKILSQILSKFIVVHQTGKITEYDDFNRLQEIRDKSPNNLKNNYYLREHFMGNELGYIYSLTDLVVGRSGANTFFELICWKKPAIFIPLPWSANQEQLSQARLFQAAGVGEIFQQSQDPRQLIDLIEKVLANADYYKSNFKNVELLYKENAAKIIVQTILSSFVS